MRTDVIISRLLASLLLAVMLASASCWLDKPDKPRPKNVFELDSGWQFREAGSDGEWLPATVPGTVHTDLFAAGKIPDPFYGDNEKDLQWIGEKEWVYTCTFDVDRSLLDHDMVMINFEGLDTYADVTLNGEALLTADNMFRKRTEKQIKPLLKEGPNRLEVRFHPPGPIEAEKREALGFSLPGGDRVFTRKAAYHYGWDWGPRFLTCGIWRPVRITGWSDIHSMDHKHKIMALSEERAVVMVTANLEYLHELSVEATLVDNNSGMRYIKNRRLKLDKKDKNSRLIYFEFFIPDPQFWWPAGLGDQNVLNYTLELRLDDILLDSADITFGLRTMELVTERDDAGESFFMRINGVPVFMKGANWIPMDSFLPRPGPDDYRRMLTAVKDANMNMLRVWGGGVYENDIFYDLCDSLGIIVWQDFMFACAMYPGDQDFIVSAYLEAWKNICRLRLHPSLAIYCGNNESDEGWQNWGWRKDYSDTLQDEIWNGYNKLFNVRLPKAIKAADYKITSQERPYLPSSPRFGRADPRSLTEGDAHYWGVWHDAEPFEVLEEKIPRFMSEFGFQSLPSMRTIEMFAGPGERYLASEAMLNHQKHARGFELIREYMERWYHVPEKFEDYIYVSQLLQAEGMRIGFEAQRRAMPYCMGSLYWQLNDCWPAVSWSSIDYSGQWKALHYTAKKAFAPVLVSTATRDGKLDLYIVSDRLEETGGWMTMKLREFGGAVLWERTIAVKAPPNASTMIFSIPVDEFLAGVDRSAVVFSAEFTCPGEDPPLAIRYFAHPKDMKLPDTGITFDIIPEGEKITLALTADVLAKNVFLDFGECHFSDNFFDILPGETVTVTLDTDIPIEKIKDGIRIRTLRNTY